MRKELVRWMSRRDGVATRAEALERFPVYVIDDALNDGALVRLLPCTYALPELRDDRPALRHAGQKYRRDGALSHLDALAVWQVPGGEHAAGPVTMVTSRDQRECKHPALDVRRRTGFRNEAPFVVVRNGLRVTRLEQAIVDSWSLLPPVDRRVPAIVAVRERRTTGVRLLETLAQHARAPGAREMRHVFGLVGGGCHSPLELWGHEGVFVGELAHARQQFPVRVGGRTVYLDRFYEEEMLDVELDGAAYHAAPGQRERDNRRDAALAALGIQTLRFSHLRLFGEPAVVAAETVAVLAMRRRQLGLGSR